MQRKSLLLFILFVLTIAYVGHRSLAQQQAASNPPNVDGAAKFRSTFPIARYDDDTTAERNTKGQKFDVIHAVNSRITENSVSVSAAHLLFKPTALPTEYSDLVLLAEVVSAKAYLSPSKSAVYSEFGLNVQEVLKGKPDQPLDTRSLLFVQRRGGIVRFANGLEHWVCVDGQGMPEIRQRYLFFLSHEFPESGKPSSELNIITAYRTDGEQVYPLDNPGGGTHPIAKKYRGKSLAKLLIDIKEKLAEEAIRR